MRKEQPIDPEYRGGLPKSWPAEFKTPFVAEEHRKNERAITALVISVILSTVVLALADQKHSENSAQNKVQKVVAPKMQAVERDARATTNDIDTLRNLTYDAQTGRFTSGGQTTANQLRHFVQTDFAADQTAYGAFSLAVSREQGQPYSNGILMQDQQTVFSALDGIPGSSTRLDVGEG